jgi:hypothetical protein
MTADQPPPAAVQIAEESIRGRVGWRSAAARVVAALARRYAFVDHAEYARLVAVEKAAREYVAASYSAARGSGSTAETWCAMLDALDAAPAEATSGEAGCECECDHVGPGLCFVHGPASQDTDDPPGDGGLPLFCP